MNSIKGRNKIPGHPVMTESITLLKKICFVHVCFLFPSCGCRQDIEQQLGSLILATDINRQNEFLTRLKAHLHNKDLRLEDVHDRHFMLQVNNNKRHILARQKHLRALLMGYLPWCKLEQ